MNKPGKYYSGYTVTMMRMTVTNISYAVMVIILTNAIVTNIFCFTSLLCYSLFLAET